MHRICFVWSHCDPVCTNCTTNACQVILWKCRLDWWRQIWLTDFSFSAFSETHTGFYHCINLVVYSLISAKHRMKHLTCGSYSWDILEVCGRFGQTFLMVGVVVSWGQRNTHSRRRLWSASETNWESESPRAPQWTLTHLAFQRSLDLAMWDFFVMKKLHILRFSVHEVKVSSSRE